MPPLSSISSRSLPFFPVSSLSLTPTPSLHRKSMASQSPTCTNGRLADRIDAATPSRAWICSAPFLPEPSPPVVIGDRRAAKYQHRPHACVDLDEPLARLTRLPRARRAWAAQRRLLQPAFHRLGRIAPPAHLCSTKLAQHQPGPKPSEVSKPPALSVARGRSIPYARCPVGPDQQLSARLCLDYLTPSALISYLMPARQLQFWPV